MPVSDNHGPAFARLWGTAKEIKVAANAWNAPETTLLMGKEVSPENFWNKTLAKLNPTLSTSRPMCWKKMRSRKRAGSRSVSARTARLSTSLRKIYWRNPFPRSSWFLSGCSSGKADIQPATGLMGLTRAWIAAGAGSVLATRWPTVDDDGAFFESFYRNLRQQDRIDSTEALRLASIEMLKSSTWRAKASFWAGYFLIGNY